MDAQLKVIKFVPITRGILTQTLVHPREVFALAIEAKAYGMVLVHNHLIVSSAGDFSLKENDQSLF